MDSRREKFHISCALETETLVVESNGERRWLGRAWGVAPRGSGFLRVERPAPVLQP